MSKLFAVVRREFVTRVKTRAFLIGTFLGPMLMAALWALPIILSKRDTGAKRVAIVDASSGQLGTRIGLDDAGVMESRALGGSVLGVGKYLSPKLYVSYGVSLLGTGQVLTLKYLLRKGFDIEIESSTVENRASVNWRTEK